MQYDRTGKKKFRNSGLSDYANLDASQSPSHSYIQLISLVNETVAGQNVKFALIATKSFSKLYAQVCLYRFDYIFVITELKLNHIGRELNMSWISCN